MEHLLHHFAIIDDVGEYKDILEQLKRDAPHVHVQSISKKEDGPFHVVMDFRTPEGVLLELADVYFGESLSDPYYRFYERESPLL